MKVSLTNLTPSFRSTPKAQVAAKDIPTQELYTQTALEGDKPYRQSNENLFSILGSLAGGPGATPGPKMTDLQRRFQKHDLSGKATAGEIRKSLAVKMAKNIGKGAAVVGLGLAMGAGSVALFTAASSLAGAAGLVLGGAALVTSLIGVSSASKDVGELKSLRQQTGDLATTAAARMNAAAEASQTNPNGTLTAF